MPKKEVAILDIGSSKMRIIIGSRGVNNTFNIVGVGESDYSGYCDGEFIDENELKYVIGLVISNAEANSGLSIKNLYVGVPAEFAVSICKTVNQNYPKRIRIKKENVAELYEKAIDKSLSDTHTVINCSPVYFVLGDNRRVLEAVKEKTNRLSGCISCIYAENGFISKMNGVLSELGVETVEYYSSSLAEILYLISEEDRDRIALVVDCGYISTSVALVRGKGLLSLHSFSLGGGHITADLADVLKIPFSSAEQLKQKIVLSVTPEKNDYYEINVQDKTLPVPMQIANSIAAARIDSIASAINKCLLLSKQEYPQYINVYITGGGVSYIKGAKDYIAKAIGRNVKIAAPKDPQMNKPHYSSILGMLELSLKEKEKNRKSFLAKWLKS